MNKILDSYLEVALWSSTQDNGSPFDDDFGAEDINPQSILAAKTDIQDFLALLEHENINWREQMSESQFGHDFWLTRNRHGCGYWDRGLGELGELLTKWADSFGSSDVYLGDDGAVYFS